MTPSESEDDIKKIDRRPDPLCLFCYPYDEAESLCCCCCGGGGGGGRGGALEEEKTYVGREEEEDSSEAAEAAVRRTRRRWPVVKEKQEMWLRRRKEVTTKRRRKASEISGRNLKSYLLMSAPTTESDTDYVPCLVGALETVKDAWGPHRRLIRPSYLEENNIFDGKGGLARIDEERDESPSTPPSPPPAPFHLFNRRSSVPEEVMRRYSLKKSIATSEDSEENQTVPDPASASSKDSYLNDEEDVQKEAADLLSGTVHATDSPIRRETSPQRLKRVTQTEYDRRGRGIIHIRTRERGSQTGRSGSSPPETTAGGDTATSDSLPSSSPVQFPAPEASTSGNLSSSSEGVGCTCQDMLSSKDTSTDPFHSGNSTLSQTVSEKSASTQDSTISIRSVSTGGDSTPSATSNYSSPDDPAPRTSAKETTSSERTPPQRRDGGRRVLGKRPPKFRRRPRAGKYFRRKKKEFCEPVRECQCSERDACNAEDILELSHREVLEEEEEAEQQARQRCEQNEIRESVSDRLNYTPEEMYMMQQMRHRKILERNLTDPGSVSACATSGSVYKRPEDVRDRILVPRYSALPRTLSMIVNTSGGDTSALNSDSDSLSLADSLEDFPVAHVNRMTYDTANERKPVRGDVNAVDTARAKVTRKKPNRSRAFFISIKDPSGENNLLPGIDRIPEPPEKIKQRIDGRQLHLRKVRLEKRRRAKERRLRKMAVNEETSSGTREEEGGKKVYRRSSSMPSPGCSTIQKEKRKKRKENEGGKGGCDVEEGAKTSVKPQAVIHPSQTTDSDRKRQPVLATQLRTSKYRQRFEAIPEEKSSSLSSTDEKKPLARRSSKPGDSPLTATPTQRKCNVPSLVFAKLVSKSLPESSDPVQRPVILVSPKSVPNSRKGRDTLIAINREDFTRLSKGWMNFYVMKEMDDEETMTETSGKREKEERKPSVKGHCGEAKTTTFAVKGRGEGAGDGSGNSKDGLGEQERKRELPETVKFNSSNTILKPIKGTPRETKKSLSLPELNLPTSVASVGEPRSPRGKLILPRVTHKSHDGDGMDSDSTVYCQPPSFIVPRLAFDGSGDFPSEGSDSDDTDTVPKMKPPTLPMKYLRKRGTAPKIRPKRDGHHHDTPKRRGSQSQSGWSVTVAGPLELTSTAPDLEMRLSFPAAPGVGMPQASHSDSGFADEGSHHVETSARDTGNLTSDGNGKQRWTVTVKNPIQGSGDGIRQRKQNKFHVLPDLGRSRDSRNVKEVLQSLSVRSSASEYHRRISIYWPKMERPRDEWVDDCTNDEELSVRGSAVTMEAKPKPLSMSDRDVTRGLTARNGHPEPTKCLK